MEYNIKLICQVFAFDLELIWFNFLFQSVGNLSLSLNIGNLVAVPGYGADKRISEFLSLPA